jgi:hypothetical protein
MFDLYQAPETAAHRRSDLLAEVAADRLARSANETDQASAVDRQSPADRLSVLVANVLATISGAVAVATRRPRWS